MSSYSTVYIVIFLGIIGICFGEELELMVEPDQFESNVTLNCVWTETVSSCFWIKNGRQVNVSGNPRYDLSGDLSECSLTIPELEPEDEGNWLCGIMHFKFPILSKVVILSKNETVLTNVVPRRIINQPKSQYVLLGKDAILNCGFAVPSQYCFWTKNNKQIAIIGRYSFIGDRLDGNCTIKISKTQFSDDGLWQCGYPQTDTEDIVRSSEAIIAVTFSPTEPVIVVNGLAVKDGTKLYLPKLITNTIYNPYTGSQIQNYLVSCWSENGSPAATLQWGIKSELTDYKPIIITEQGYQTLVSVNPAAKSLKIASLLFPNNHMNQQWQYLHLICSASHPTYDRNHTTSVQLVFGYN